MSRVPCAATARRPSIVSSVARSSKRPPARFASCVRSAGAGRRRGGTRPPPPPLGPWAGGAVGEEGIPAREVYLSLSRAAETEYLKEQQEPRRSKPRHTATLAHRGDGTRAALIILSARTDAARDAFRRCGALPGRHANRARGEASRRTAEQSRRVPRQEASRAANGRSSDAHSLPAAALFSPSCSFLMSSGVSCGRSIDRVILSILPV